MIIYPLKLEHKKTIIKAHMESWAKDELSVLLGEKFVSSFYDRAIIDESTLAYGAVRDPKASVECWCLGFSKYNNFNRQFKASIPIKSLIAVIQKVLRREISLSVLFDILTPYNINGKLKCPDNHLGAFGRTGNSFGEVILLQRLVKHVANRLCKDKPACWAVTNKINRGGAVILERAGFYSVAEVKQWSRTLVFYEFSVDC